MNFYRSRKDAEGRKKREIFHAHLPSILLRSALWRSGFSSANFLRSTFAQTMNAFIGRRIRCSLRLLWAVPPPGWHIFTPAGIGEIPGWYSSDGPEANHGISSSRCCAGPDSILGICFQEMVHSIRYTLVDVQRLFIQRRVSTNLKIIFKLSVRVLSDVV